MGRILSRVLALLIVVVLAIACLPSIVFDGADVFEIGSEDPSYLFEQDSPDADDSDEGHLVASSEVFDVSMRVQYGQDEAHTILAMINDFRTGDDAWYWNSDDATKTECAGLSTLTYDYNLERVAMLRAAEVALSFSHTRPNGELFATAYQECGYVYRAAGENIAAGYVSAPEVFEGWQEADEDYAGQDHRRNMLSSDFDSVGIGHISYNGVDYWVQEFGRGLSSNAEESAGDGEADVLVSVRGSDVVSLSCVPSPDGYDLSVGMRAGLPAVAGTIQLAESWPDEAKPISVPVSWTSSDDAVASVSEGEVVAQGAGYAELTASVLDQTMTVPATVQP